MSNEKTTHKFRIGFNQSVSTGVIGLEGYVLSDSIEQLQNHDLHHLEAAMETFEEILSQKGYQVASQSAPKSHKYTNGV